jgi:hypothetical protein
MTLRATYARPVAPNVIDKHSAPLLFLESNVILQRGKQYMLGPLPDTSSTRTFYPRLLSCMASRDMLLAMTSHDVFLALSARPCDGGTPRPSVFWQLMVGRCRLPISKPELNAHLLSALETKM